MSNVICKPVESSREKKQFLNLPWDLYRGDPHWMPPLRGNQKELVGYKPHPFYDDAEAQTFLALQDGRPCGRIAAIVNHAHNRLFNDKVGFFGFFESIDEPAVANALFDSAGRWLAERGMTTIRGPMNPSLHYEIGLLIEGFDAPPRFMTTYNPAYYVRLVEQYGFSKATDLLSYWGHIGMLETLDKKLDFVIAEATRRFNIKVRPLDRKRFDKDVQTFLHIFNESMRAHWGFVPMSQSEVKHTAASLKHLICPELTSFAEVDGKTIGAVFGLLDYNPRIKKSDGYLLPFIARLMWGRRSIKQMRIIAAEVLPEYQKWGVGLVLLQRLRPEALAWGIEECEFSWVIESNKLSRGSLERGGAKLIKTHRIYDREIM